MDRSVRLTLLWSAIGGAAAAGALALGYSTLVPDNDELVERLRAQAEAHLGVEVGFGTAQLRLWPRPELVIEDAVTVQPQPLRIRRVVAQARWMPLLRGRLELDDVHVEGALLPQASLRALRIGPARDGSDANTVRVSQLHFRDVVWITRYGNPLEFSGSASFGPGWHLRQAEVVRPGVRPVARIALVPDGKDRWKVDLRAGGGTAQGAITLTTGADGAMALSGQLAANDVDVASLLAGFQRQSVLTGKASGQISLTASGGHIGELARSLHTRTTFTMAAPRLLHIDVDKATRSSGRDRAGETALLSLTGQMDTQNTAQGMVIIYTDLQAKGQAFSASGQGTIANRHIDGQLAVDLAGGLTGVPLTVSGPLAQPQVTVAAPASTVAVTGAASAAPAR